MEEGEIIEVEVQEVHPGYIKIEYEGKAQRNKLLSLRGNLSWSIHPGMRMLAKNFELKS